MHPKHKTRRRNENRRSAREHSDNAERHQVESCGISTRKRVISKAYSIILYKIPEQNNSFCVVIVAQGGQYVGITEIC